MKATCLILLISFFASTSYAQKASGIYTVNEKDEPVEDALVCIINVENGSLIGSMLVDSTGYADISKVNFEKEKLKVMAFGYKDADLTDMSANEVLKVRLIPLQAELAEVVVDALSLVTQKIDRFVFNLNNANITKGNTTFEVLRFTPFITIDDVSRSISMVGKTGVQLYINGRKSNLPESSIRPYLETLSAEKIASIEIITDPGATMRTEGNQGVINIVLKKNESDGINGTLTIADNQKKRYNSQEGGLYLNYQKNKFNLSANVYAENPTSEDRLASEYRYVSANTFQTVTGRDKSAYNTLNGTIMADYNLSEKQVIGFSFNGSYNNNTHKRTDRTSFGRMSELEMDSVLHSGNDMKSPVRNYFLNLNYRLKTSAKGNLSVDLDYLSNEKEQIVQNVFARVERETVLPPHESFRQNSKEVLSGYSGKVEYSHAFDDRNNVTLGTNAYTNSSDADFFYGIRQNGEYVSDPGKSNSFSYKESYTGVYVSYSRVWSSKFNSRIEARVESFHSEGVQKVTSEEIKRDYLDILPSLSLQYLINPDNRLSYNFSSNAARPGYYSLNPFRFYLTPTTYKEYNPDLKPAYVYNNTLSYSLKGNYIFNLYYIYIKDCTNNFLVPVDEKYTKYINANYGTLRSLSLAFIWNQSFWENRFSMNFQLVGNYRKDKGSVESIEVDVSAFSSNTSFTGNVLLSRRYNWNLTGSFSYYSPMKLAYVDISGSYSARVELRKSFSNDISLKMGVKHLFFNTPGRGRGNSNYEYYTNNEYDFRTAYIGISIPFGNRKAKVVNSRRPSSEMKERVKE